jgi:hypothetical protein
MLLAAIHDELWLFPNQWSAEDKKRVGKKW